MSQQDTDQADKSFEPTQQKLDEARKKGEVAKSADLSVAASYLGFVVLLLALGENTIRTFASELMVFIDRPDMLMSLQMDGSAPVHLRAAVQAAGLAALAWFVIPAASVLASILAQRAFVVAPSKLVPKLSRISPMANAKQKFGRSGLFEFAKSFAKLVLFSACLTLFIRANLSDIVTLAGSDPAIIVTELGRHSLGFIVLVTLIALAIGAIDTVWQYFDHMRRNRMTRQEIMDETKSSEGDPHLKQTRRQKGQALARNQMLADVPTADVVVVNPTHYAVALKWSRLPGTAPVCVAKGTDEIAARIREIAIEAGVPLHSDPPTARALHAAVGIGDEIDEAHYRAVAAAIRFAEDMRNRARHRGL